MALALVIKNNYRWDATREKIYTLSDSTIRLLKTLHESDIQVTAFYPHDDPARVNLEVFLKQAQLYHRGFKFQFFDPDRVPSLAQKYGVKSYYTVVIQYQDRSENIVAPTEESFTNALLRISNPKKFNVCFVTGHEEASTVTETREGLSQLKSALQTINYGLHDIILLRDKVPAFCNVVIVAGPRQNFDPIEFKHLEKTFRSGRGILFLIDPMDPGTSKLYKEFLKKFGVLLGEDVIVDKMSRLVGGDFLVPLVNQYVTQHPITMNFEKPTFFPVSRSLQPSDSAPKDFEVVPLAVTSNGSWAETNLQSLEKGEAVFEPVNADLQGPIPVVVAIERKSVPSSENAKEQKPSPPSRMVVVGDSDFVTNAYLSLSGNHDFVLNILHWLSQDDRFISIHPREPEFKPLFLASPQRTFLLLVSVVGMPLAALLFGGITQWFRKRSAA